MGFIRFDDMALECFNWAIEQNPQDSGFWKLKGRTLNDLRRYEEALICYDKVIELCATDAEAWVSKGYIFDRLGRGSEREQCFDKAKDIDPYVRIGPDLSRLATTTEGHGLVKKILGYFGID